MTTQSPNMALQTLNVHPSAIDPTVHKNPRSSGHDANDKKSREAFALLCGNIEANIKDGGPGIMNALCVTKHPTDPKRFALFAGWGRLEAANKLKLDDVPIRVFPKPMTEAQIVRLSWSENIARKDMHWTENVECAAGLLKEKLGEEAKLLREKSDKRTSAFNELAAETGLQRTRVYVLAKLATYPDVLKEAFRRHKAEEPCLNSTKSADFISGYTKDNPEATDAAVLAAWIKECDKQPDPEQSKTDPKDKGDKETTPKQALTLAEINAVVEYFCQQKAMGKRLTPIQEGMYLAFGLLTFEVNVKKYLDNGGPSDKDFEISQKAFEAFADAEAVQAEADRKKRAADTAAKK